MAGIGSMSDTANGALAGPLDLNYEPIRARDSLMTRQVILRAENNGNHESELAFNFKMMGKFYKQLDSCKLYIQARVVKGDGTPIDSMVDSVVPCNNMGPSLFSECEIHVNGEPVSELATTNFPYKNFFETLLSFGTESLNTHLPLMGFHMDTPGVFEYICNENEGACIRRDIIKNSQTWESMMPILNDFLRSRQQLYHEVEARVRLLRTPPRFYFMCDERDIAKDYKVVIDAATLTLNYIENDDAIRKTHEHLYRDKGLKMQMTKTQIRTYDVNAGHTSKQITIQDSTPALPNLMIVVMLPSVAFNGSWMRYPYYFHHHNLRAGSITVNGQTLPERPYGVRFSGNNVLFMQDYTEFLSNIGVYFNSDVGCLVTPEAYMNGSYIMSFDLTSDRCANFHHHCKETGSIDLNLDFGVAPTENLTVIVYSIYNAHVELHYKDKPKVVIG